MCLDRFKVFEENSKHVGYKIVEKLSENQYEAIHYGYKFKMNEEHISDDSQTYWKNEYITMRTGMSYKVGFHIYDKLKDAKLIVGGYLGSRHLCIIKCKYNMKDILAMGFENVYVKKMIPTLVVKKLKVIKEINI